MSCTYALITITGSSLIECHLNFSSTYTKAVEVSPVTHRPRSTTAVGVYSACETAAAAAAAAAEAEAEAHATCLRRVHESASRRSCLLLQSLSVYLINAGGRVRESIELRILSVRPTNDATDRDHERIDEARRQRSAARLRSTGTAHRVLRFSEGSPVSHLEPAFPSTTPISVLQAI
ncbi:unnamed protein product [Trichogramma brassicae]|uniref:Uncharacterized protein n=1 Tax=Trichogramma brassicae TaxID=86971 RepID=A0A6H5IBT1_9HYME|nr:unnamed protein product [Trichogramma brassicae]